MRISRRSLLRFGPAFGLAELAGCAVPPAQYYRLVVVPGSASNSVQETVRLRNVVIPGYLDQDGIAKVTSEYQFATFANDLWAEPLADMLQSTMVQDLTQRLPRANVVGGNGVIGASADTLIDMDVQRFDPDPSGSIILTVQIALKSVAGETPLFVQTLHGSATPAGSGAIDIVSTMSILWAGIANEVAGLIVDDSLRSTAMVPSAG